MNFLVCNSGSSRCTFRPDSTWERHSSDFYPQDDVLRIAFSPVLWLRVGKAGKAVETRFADRYRDGTGYGLLLYDAGLLSAGTPSGYAQAIVEDQTTYLPFEPQDRVGEFRILKDGDELFRFAERQPEHLLRQAVVMASARTYIRTGDRILWELAPPRPAWSRGERVRLTAMLDGTPFLDFNIL